MNTMKAYRGSRDKVLPIPNYCASKECVVNVKPRQFCDN